MINLLYALLKLGNQNAKAQFIKNKYECVSDIYGNLYINRDFTNRKPYVVAHLDIVQEMKSKNRKLIVDPFKEILSATYNNKPCVLGGDDGVGIYAALSLFENNDIGVALFRDEEIGCIGSKNADLSLINASYVLQLDRKGNSDIIFNTAGTIIASDEFQQHVSNIADKFNYKPCRGGMTDVMALSENGLNVSCLNMSCGYYKAHTSDEYIKINDMNKSIKLAQKIIYELGDTHYPHECSYEYNLYNSQNNFYDQSSLFGGDIRQYLMNLVESTLTSTEIIQELEQLFMW